MKSVPAFPVMMAVWATSEKVLYAVQSTRHADEKISTAYHLP